MATDDDEHDAAAAADDDDDDDDDDDYGGDDADDEYDDGADVADVVDVVVDVVADVAVDGGGAVAVAVDVAAADYVSGTRDLAYLHPMFDPKTCTHGDLHPAISAVHQDDATRTRSPRYTNNMQQHALTNKMPPHGPSYRWQRRWRCRRDLSSRRLLPRWRVDCPQRLHTA